MHSNFFTVAALFASGAFAAQNWVKVESATVHGLRALRIRQGGESFVPPTSDGYGESCADAFGKGHILCADSETCYNPDEGQICCDAGYPCPANSFCFGDGHCCPDGLSRKECAEKLGVPEPTSSPSEPEPTPEPTPEPEPQPTKPAGDVVTLTTTICESTMAPPTYPTGPGVPTSGIPQPTNSIPTSIPTTTPPPFDGAGSVNGVATGSLAVVAILGLVQNLL